MNRGLLKLLTSLISCTLLCLLITPEALARPTTIDGDATDWLDRAPTAPNLGLIARDAAGGGELVWLDAVGDQRTDFPSFSIDGVDLRQFRVTGTPTHLAMLFVLGGELGSGEGAVQLQVALDLDQAPGSGAEFFAGFSDTRLPDAGRWEHLVQTRYGSAQAPALLDASYAVTATLDEASALVGAEQVVELRVPWSALGLTGPPATPVRMAVAVFRASAADLVYSTAPYPAALDVLSDLGDPVADAASAPNTFAEFDAGGGAADEVLDDHVVVHFDAAGEVRAPARLEAFLSAPDPGLAQTAWVGVRNVTDAPLVLDGFRLGDEEMPDEGEGMRTLPEGVSLDPGEVAVVAGDAALYEALYGQAPVAVFADMAPSSTWSTGPLALNAAGDQLLLLDATGTLLDVVAYGAGAYPGVVAYSPAPALGEVLTRDGGAVDTDDATRDFALQGNVAPTRVALSASSISEASVAGDEVGALTVFDPNAGDTHLLALIDDAGGRFLVDGDVLKVADGDLLDHALDPSHEVVVRATDAGGLTFEQPLSVTVTEAGQTGNEAPTDLTLTATSVAEGSPTGTLIGVLSAVDPDAGDAHTFTLINNAGGRFRLTLDALEVANSALIDYETDTSHPVTVRVTDAGGLSFENTFIIEVTDVEDSANRAPTAIVLSSQTIAENSPGGAPVGLLSALDPDAGDAHTFSLVDDAAGRFQVDGAALEVAPGAALDHETATSHDVTVRATDVDGLTFDETFTIDILDVIEDGTNEPPTGVSLSSLSVDERAEAGTLVGLFSTLDPDEGDVHAYVLLDDAGGRFVARDDRLEVANGALLDYETNAAYEILVRATDAGGRAFGQTFTITLNDVNEQPSAADQSVATPAGEPITFELAVFDPDLGDVLTISVLNEPTQGSLDLEGMTVTYTPPSDFSGIDRFIYRVHDSEGLDSRVTTVTINIGGGCPLGAICNDGDPCTSQDVCAAQGLCSGAPLDCSALDSECGRGVCDPTTSACIIDVRREGQSCDDGSACTADDTCVAGRCEGEALANGTVCEGAERGVCLESACVDGLCETSPRPDGVACESGDPCAANTVCGGGACIGGDNTCRPDADADAGDDLVAELEDFTPTVSVDDDESCSCRAVRRASASGGAPGAPLLLAVAAFILSLAVARRRRASHG